MSPETSVSAMADKAQTRGKRIQQENAAQVDRVKLWTKSETKDYLTKYCKAIAENLTILSKCCRVIGIAEGEWLVVTPGKCPS